MIGTSLVEQLVQSVALSHRIAGYSRVSLLMLAAPESGKTTIATAATCKHVCRIAVITGRSIMREVREHPKTEILLFNDLSSVRAMSHQASALLVVILNQITQDEHGLIAFAGKDTEVIDRPLGIIACLPFKTFTDHRARWKELGFISRMIPFAYSYPDNLVAQIKDGVDDGTAQKTKLPKRKMPRVGRRPVQVSVSSDKKGFTRKIRNLADARSKSLGQIGIRLLQSYHCLIRAHALLHGRRRVTEDDMRFLKDVDRFVSIDVCRPLDGED